MENKEKRKTKEKFTPYLVIDASNAPAGRVASYAAKQALLGKTLAVINCDNALITGRRSTTIAEFREMRQRGGHSLKGPFYPKHTEKIMKRMIRGMIRYKKGRGAEAFKRIRCYNDIPKEYESVKKISMSREIKTRAISLNELSREI